MVGSGEGVGGLIATMGGLFCCLEQDATVERAAAALQLQPPAGAGLGPGAVLPVSPGW